MIDVDPPYACPTCAKAHNDNGDGPMHDVVDRKQALLIYLMGCVVCTLLGVLMGLVLHDMVVK